MRLISLSAALWIAMATPAAAADTAIVGHDDNENHFSPLSAINADNVGRLGLAWSYDLDTRRGEEATPIVVDGVLYTSTAWSKVLAFDAASGRLLWQFDPKVPGATAIHTCCDVVNRGVAIWQRRVYVGTLDGRLIALDARNGQPIWSVSTVDASRPYTSTGAPLVVGGRVVIGNSGAEYGVRGYVSAYDARTGKLDWRFYTVPGDPSKGFENPQLESAARSWSGQWWLDGGGATVWNAFSYDPKLDLLYFGTGNASPWGRREDSPVPLDNLFASCIVAVHASSGQYAWHFQTTPGDHWDYDADQNLPLATLTIDGKTRDVVMQASKNGYFYVLDRRTGELLAADNFVPVNWATGLDARTGRPIVNPEARYYETGKVWVSQPGALGAHSWQPMAYSPATSLVYIPAQEVGQPYLRDPDFKRQTVGMNNDLDMASTSLPDDPAVQQAVMATLKGYLSAWDPRARRERWRVELRGPWNGGVLATAGNLVFQGTAAGELQAFNASDGRKLWSYAVQTGVLAAPMTYSIKGAQYVSVMVGWGGVFPLVAGELSFKSGHQVNRSRLLTFRLDAKGQLPAPPAAAAPGVHAPPGPTDAEQVARGARFYTRDCSGCHGDAAVAGGVVPDLRFSAALDSDEFWRTVVDDGALSSEGMIGFKSVLTADQINDVRAFLRQRAQAAANRH
jgi:alcohol dehydrogenase (cytochrome c)/quinohemoprotein ethanol dehydrogenase